MLKWIIGIIIAIVAVIGGIAIFKKKSNYFIP